LTWHALSVADLNWSDSDMACVVSGRPESSCCAPRAAAEGKGKIVDAHTVEVALPSGGSRRLTAKYILVATGGVATRLDIEGAVSHLMHLDAAFVEAAGKVVKS
jgi:hypothetical protein